MKLQNFISSCRHRVRINNRGNEMSISCQHCPDCLQMKANHYSQLCVSEAKSHSYELFVTLTYADDCVPCAMLSSVTCGDLDFLDLIDVTERKLKNGNFKTFRTYGQQVGRIFTDWHDPKFRAFYAQQNTTSKLFEKKTYPFIRFLHKPDLQNFFKRLRNRLEAFSDANIRYFACGEYGPGTFRPHYHALLFFDDYQIAQNIGECIRKAWKFGTVDFSFVRDRDASAKYVASYCNSFLALPSFLAPDAIAPFTIHSRYFGVNHLRKIKEYVYEDTTRYFEASVMPDGVNTLSYFPTSVGLRTLFPRCYGFDRIDNPTALSLYVAHREFTSKYPSTTVSELAKRLLIEYENDWSIRNFLRKLEMTALPCSDGVHPTAYPILTLKPASYYEDLFATAPYAPLDEDKTVFSRIYSALSVSKHFLTFCCNEDRTPMTMVKLIRDFYDKRQRFNLAMMYNAMQEYYETYCPLSPHYFLSDDSMYDYFGAFYSIFYQVGLNSTIYRKGTYQDLYEKHPYIKIINRAKDIKYHNNIKHKVQNELNIQKYGL